MNEEQVKALHDAGWLSPDDRAAIVNGIEWLVSQHHKVQHKAMIKLGRRSHSSCDAQTCKYATQLLSWLNPQQEGNV